MALMEMNKPINIKMVPGKTNLITINLIFKEHGLGFFPFPLQRMSLASLSADLYVSDSIMAAVFRF